MKLEALIDALLIADSGTNRDKLTARIAGEIQRLERIERLACDLVAALCDEAVASESIARRFRRPVLGPFDNTYKLIDRARKEIGLDIRLYNLSGIEHRIE